MIFGVSTACMYPKQMELILDQYAESGIRDIEIFVNTFTELSPEFLRGMEQQIRDGGFHVHSIHPFTSGLEPLMLFSEYARRVDDMIDFYKRYFEMMQRFGAKVFVFHGDRKEGRHGVSFYAEKYAALREAGKPYGVTVAQENVARCKSGNLEFLQGLIGELGDEISFVLDIKQALRSGHDPMEVLNVMGRRVVHLHANDHTRTADCLLPGAGTFDFAGMFRKIRDLGIDPTVVVEVYRDNFGHGAELVKALEYLKSVDAKI